MPTLKLIGVRCRDLEHSRRFYEALGITFTPDQHGAAPLHYSARLGATVLELYAASAAATTVRLGLGVTDVNRAAESFAAMSGESITNRPQPREPRLSVIRTTMLSN